MQNGPTEGHQTVTGCETCDELVDERITTLIERLIDCHATDCSTVVGTWDDVKSIVEGEIEQ